MKQPNHAASQNSSLDNLVQRLRQRWKQRWKLWEWQRRGRPVPPPHLVKQRVLRDYAKAYDLKILVETGTCHGEMVEAMRRVFDSIYSIELSRDLYEAAVNRFREYGHIELIHGDSGVELGKLKQKINRPALFWLDGHYSGGVTAKGERATPIFEELRDIFSIPTHGHVIIVDDARCFGTDPAYPSLEELKQFVLANKANAQIAVEYDSIRITPSAHAA